MLRRNDLILLLRLNNFLTFIKGGINTGGLPEDWKFNELVKA
jgi:hypothetical protein